jgi:uncharacterized Zn finger protein
VAKKRRRSWGGDWDRGWGGFAPYVSVDERRQMADKEIAQRAKKGQVLSPVRPEGRALASTFWGKAWCDHVEHHCDEANRLPRGRAYFRNGSVIHLKVAPGHVTALVQGSDLYEVGIQVAPLDPAAWSGLARDCSGRIESLVELLQGRLDKGVLGRLCDPERGMFPRRRQMTFDCSCPDGASICKHVAAALYGVGNRLDASPELLFVLRQVDQGELLRQAAVAPVATAGAPERRLDDVDLGDVFGIDFDATEVDRPLPVVPVPSIQATQATTKPSTASMVAPPSRADIAPPPASSKAKSVTPMTRKSSAQHRIGTRSDLPDVPAVGPVAEAAAAFVLQTLRTHPDRELRVADLLEEGRGHFPRQDLERAAQLLLGRGLVTCEREGRVVWWGVATRGSS